jgi:hypothetical protein
MPQGQAFDQLNPPRHVTDPEGRGATQEDYPRHLHKAGISTDKGPLYVVVHTPDEEAEALADGWSRTKPNPNDPIAPHDGDPLPAAKAPPPRRRG